MDSAAPSLSADPPRLAIVMPAYNAAHLVERTVTAALMAAERAALPCPVLVVDPGSDDGTPDRAAELGARVLRLGRRAGPAEARNAGVAHLGSEIDVVVFIDADCVAHADVVERVEAAFAGTPDLVSLTGSYDDTPPETNFASLYMNLRHHAVHQAAAAEPASFWAGCGAVRVETFRRIGGFDAAQFPMPMIEDIELGMRLRPLGRTRLDPALHVTHLKRWTVASVVRTDIVCRAIPWSRLIHASGELPNDLNTKLSQRLAAFVAPFALLGLPALVLAFLLHPAWAAWPAVAWTLAVLLNASILRVFLARRGLLFALAAGTFHQVHLLYSAVTFVAVGLAPGRGRPQAVPA